MGPSEKSKKILQRKRKNYKNIQERTKWATASDFTLSAKDHKGGKQEF